MRTILYRQDPDTIEIPYTVGDRLRVTRLGWWMAGLTFLIGSGMVMSYLRFG